MVARRAECVACCVLRVDRDHAFRADLASLALSVHVYYPVDDRGYVRRQLALVLGASLVGCITIAIVLGAVAAIQPATIATWFLVGLFCIADWLAVAAAAILITAYVRWWIPIDFVGVGAILAFVCVGPALGGGGAQAGAMSPAIAYALFALSPPGWVHAAFYFGAIQGSWAAWLFLLPAATVIGLAVRWFTGTFEIRDIAFFEDRAAIAALDGSMRLATPLFWDPQRRALAAATRRKSQLASAERRSRAECHSTERLLPSARLGAAGLARTVCRGTADRAATLALGMRQSRPALLDPALGNRSWRSQRQQGLALCWTSDTRDSTLEFAAGLLNVAGLLAAIFSVSSMGSRGAPGTRIFQSAPTSCCRPRRTSTLSRGRRDSRHVGLERHWRDARRAVHFRHGSRLRFLLPGGVRLVFVRLLSYGVEFDERYRKSPGFRWLVRSSMLAGFAFAGRHFSAGRIPTAERSGGIAPCLGHVARLRLDVGPLRHRHRALISGASRPGSLAARLRAGVASIERHAK